MLDEDGNDLPPGQIGTIYAKRVDGTPSYFGDPAKTAAMVRPDGRFTVGDLQTQNLDRGLRGSGG